MMKTMTLDSSGKHKNDLKELYHMIHQTCKNN
ncbi:histidinol-phosphate aminotransferase, chloroplastic-like [Iris pallida]|uniref:Histidinol-phosphate aminotransferase, chloroplastic-like n=1 Tax=Iris pallida TaxID=29817 RepID=A0AAX6FK34_IRIPA|nr:histidinol-phosphate aminotransferase, chloroplastic-like [Iris pallida]